MKVPAHNTEIGRALRMLASIREPMTEVALAGMATAHRLKLNATSQRYPGLLKRHDGADGVIRWSVTAKGREALKTHPLPAHGTNLRRVMDIVVSTGEVLSTKEVAARAGVTVDSARPDLRACCHKWPAVVRRVRNGHFVRTDEAQAILARDPDSAGKGIQWVAPEIEHPKEGSREHTMLMLMHGHTSIHARDLLKASGLTPAAAARALDSLLEGWPWLAHRDRREYRLHDWGRLVTAAYTHKPRDTDAPSPDYPINSVCAEGPML